MKISLTKLSFVSVVLLALLVNSTLSVSAKGTRGSISGKTVVGGLLSLLIWPGIGQAVNDSPGDKVLTHAVVGLLPPFRFWSGYDALYNRQGGYWKGKV
jgi:hypothetical protein